MFASRPRCGALHGEMQAVKRAVVLGAGIQGACAALALAQENYRVTLVDRAPRALDRASLRNEGKIHLGFVYANDPSMRTSFLMLETALEFAGLVERFVGREIDWCKIKSSPFVYYVVHDSLGGPRARARALRGDPGSLSRPHRAGSLAVLSGRAAGPPLLVRFARGGDGGLPPLRGATGADDRDRRGAADLLRDAESGESPPTSGSSAGSASRSRRCYRPRAAAGKRWAWRARTGPPGRPPATSSSTACGTVGCRSTARWASFPTGPGCIGSSIA